MAIFVVCNPMRSASLKRLGVADESLIKAIEAAALLHDTGKLAIPEYILNKPGKLSSIEFEKMKQHASIGADILSAIDFPYPVVPIVRHHHENWDGTGYPAASGAPKYPLALGFSRLLIVLTPSLPTAPIVRVLLTPPPADSQSA